MKKSIVLFCSAASLILVNFGNAALFARDEVKKEHKEEHKEAKLEEIKLEGKIEKKDKDYYIKTKTEELKLPVSKEKEPKIKLEEFVNKDVVLMGKGTVHKTKHGHDEIEKHVIESINEVKVVESDKDKKEEKK